MNRTTKTVAAVAIALTSGTSANAARPPTASEAAAIQAATGIVVSCQRAKISTVDTSWGYASSTNDFGCFQGTGYFLLRRTAPGFSIVNQGSFDPQPCASLAGVPSAVGLDLGLCRRPLVFIGCGVSSPDGGLYATPKVKPRRCGILALRGTGLSLRSMRWRGWGRAVARGRGLAFPATRIRVKVYRRVRLRGGDRCYTRMKYHTKFGGGTMRLVPKCQT